MADLNIYLFTRISCPTMHFVMAQVLAGGKELVAHTEGPRDRSVQLSPLVA